VIIRHRSLSIR